MWESRAQRPRHAGALAAWQGPSRGSEGLGLGAAEEGQRPGPLFPSRGGSATGSVATAEPFPGAEGAVAREGSLGPAPEERSGGLSGLPPQLCTAPLAPCWPLRGPFRHLWAKPKRLPKAREGKGWLPRGTVAMFVHSGRQRPVVWTGAPRWPPHAGRMDWGAGEAPGWCAAAP